MKSQSKKSFFILLVFGEAIFPLGRGKFVWVKFENAPGNEFEKYSFGKPNFSFGEDFVGKIYIGVFLTLFSNFHILHWLG